MTQTLAASDLDGIKSRLVAHALDLGFQQVGVTGIDLREDERHLAQWLSEGRHGGMQFMARHGQRRSHPEELVPGTVRVVSVRMDSRPRRAADERSVLDDPGRAYIARYALGRDYHRIMRSRLQQLASTLAAEIGPFGYRAFVDSAPVMEKPLARNAGLGWIGKHTNLISTQAGSLFMLGELYTDLPLPVDMRGSDHCGSCSACLPACPTGAITAPYQLDARRCISYLTIELHGPVPQEFRESMGNRIFGCDDCQLVCPWNKFARHAQDSGFEPRHGLDAPTLVALFGWSEEEYLSKSEGTALRRLGYQRWLRNLAVALGNAPSTPSVVSALSARSDHPDELVREHVAWALSRHETRSDSSLHPGTPD